jgi:uncharacterized membrane protein YphA (DoxX/SURF4 family)
LVGGIWVAAGAAKLLDPSASVRAVRAYRILPEAVVPWVGHGLPALEMVIGALLVLGLGLRLVSLLSALLLLAFIIGISSVWARGIEIDCGCFGGGGEAVNATAKYPWDIARDVGLFVLSALMFVWPRSRLTLDGVILPPIEEPEIEEYSR